LNEFSLNFFFRSRKKKFIAERKIKMLLRMNGMLQAARMSGRVRSMQTSAAACSSKFDEREKAFEERYVRKHEREALERLRKKLADEGKADAGVNEAIDDVAACISDGRAEESQEETVSHDELLDLRREVMAKLRSLEDENAELKANLRRLAKK
jgi:Mitochondrial ATPase inhibitor, IATP